MRGSANQRSFTLGIYVAVVTALLDQLSKWWVVEFAMNPPHVMPVLPSLNFTLNWNHGVTFGLFNAPREWGSYIFIAIALVILLALAGWLWRSTTMLVATGLGLVIGGAIGNIVDRLRFGAVTDFIDFYVGSYHWYTFNLADSAIVCGVGLLLIENLVTGHKKG